jgi:hypothetical protein
MPTDHCPGQDTRFWKPGDIFDIVCPSCGGAVEFFKDESRRICKKCGYEIPNPKLNLGCAQWCEHAADCLGAQAALAGGGAGEQALGQKLKIKLISEMKLVFGNDLRRINHALKVLQNAEKILECEKADPVVVIAAAILHDIGIREAERKHGSSAGMYQEMEGPPIARAILEKLNVEPERIEQVCAIVGSHHSARGADSPEFDIIWDADHIVNVADELSGRGRVELCAYIEKVFRTAPGKNKAIELYCTEYTHGADDENLTASTV